MYKWASVRPILDFKINFPYTSIEKWLLFDRYVYHYSPLIDDPIERATYSNEAQPGNDEAYYNIAEITTFIRTEELQRVISEKDTKENNAFLDEYKVVWELKL